MDNRYSYTQEEMEEIRKTTSGFYNVDPDGVTLLFGRFYVLHRDFELHRHLKDTYTYPVYGWSWYESEEQARAALNCPRPLSREELLAQARADMREKLEATGQFDAQEIDRMLENLNS